MKGEKNNNILVKGKKEKHKCKVCSPNNGILECKVGGLNVLQIAAYPGSLKKGNNLSLSAKCGTSETWRTLHSIHKN